MIKLTLLILAITISTGFLQEITRLLEPTPSNDNKESQIWTLQNLQEGLRHVKPCPRRSNKNGDEEQWIPSYSSRITHPLYENTVLQPQALKNEDFLNTVEPETSSDQLSYPSRRLSGSGNIDALNEDDCVDQLDAAEKVPLKKVDLEKMAVSIIKDCLTKKQDDKIIGSSRRSMSDPDDSAFINNDSNDNNYPRHGTLGDSNLLDDDNKDNYASEEKDADSTRNGKLEKNAEDRNTDHLTTKSIDLEARNDATGRRAKFIQRNPRICYACSTATNPSCWNPTNRTTIKYCTRENSCITKTFGVKNSLTLIRDCANSCEDSPVPGLEPKYKSCKLCHSDYCNAAISVNSFNFIIILIIGIVKCAF